MINALVFLLVKVH